jgi:hypothetical protein
MCLYVRRARNKSPIEAFIGNYLLFNIYRMKTSRLITVFTTLIFLFAYSITAMAQVTLDGHGHQLGATNQSGGYNSSFLFSMMELPFLFIAVIFAFLTATALKGGKFGKGMYMVAWGFVVMAIGHLHMQVEHYYGFNLFKSLLGETAGSIAWFLALILTWGLSSLGFYSIYKTSKG